MTDWRYMLDTNIVSAMLRSPVGRLAERLEATRAERLCVSALVASELRFGARKKDSARLVGLVEEILARVDILPYDAGASVAYAQIRSSLERRGIPIGLTDLFIAAHALSLDLTLVTANVREFSRVEGLKVENWLEPAP